MGCCCTHTSRMGNYCKILSKVTKEVKKLYYTEVITKSKNKMKTTWNIIVI